MQKNILIIDDSEVVLAMAKDALEDAGYNVATATNGIEANRVIFSRNRPSLIIMDVMMPMLDGNKQTKILKQNEVSRDIPILLFSSKSEPELRVLAEESGADGYLMKPFTPIEIISRVRRFLIGMGRQPVPAVAGLR